MVSNQLSIYSMLTFIYQIYLVMPAPPQFPDGWGHSLVSGVWTVVEHTH